MALFLLILVTPTLKFHLPQTFPFPQAPKAQKKILKKQLLQLLGTSEVCAPSVSPSFGWGEQQEKAEFGAQRAPRGSQSSSGHPLNPLGAPKIQDRAGRGGRSSPLEFHPQYPVRNPVRRGSKRQEKGESCSSRLLKTLPLLPHIHRPMKSHRTQHENSRISLEITDCTIPCFFFFFMQKSTQLVLYPCNLDYYINGVCFLCLRAASG